MGKDCGSCRYYEVADELSGECRYYPPKIIPKMLEWFDGGEDLGVLGATRYPMVPVKGYACRQLTVR